MLTGEILSASDIFEKLPIFTEICLYGRHSCCSSNRLLGFLIVCDVMNMPEDGNQLLFLHKKNILLFVFS